MSCSKLDDDRRCTDPRTVVFGLRAGTRRCARCPHYDGPSRGLGDVVAKVTKTVGLPSCGPCQKRREALNAAVPNPFKGA
jgi:hypothetical protein